MNKVGAIILAAGKGSRMNAKESNKVTFMLGDKPMIMHVVHLLEKIKIEPIVIVIGFAKDSVRSLFTNDVLFAEQTKRLGTAHATYRAMQVLPEAVEHVFVLNGDDSAFYTETILEGLLSEHLKNDNDLTFLTLSVKNPFGLGRIVRDKKGQVAAIVEEKDATDEQRKIKEINPACYLFKTSFLKKYLGKVKKSKATREYYIVSLIETAINNNLKVEGIKGGNIPWRGVNTGEELQLAEKLFSKLKSN